MKKIAYIAIGVMLLGITSCTQEDSPLHATAPDALAQLPGDTPVILETAIAGTGVVEARSTNEPLYAVGEIHAATTGSLTQTLDMPGGSNGTQKSLAGTFADMTGNAPLYLKDFNLVASGNSCVTRWTTLQVSNSTDDLQGWAKLRLDATTQQPVLTYELQHTGARISLNVVDGSDNPIDMTPNENTAVVSLMPSLVTIVYENGQNGGDCATFLNTIATNTSDPMDASIDATKIGLAACSSGSSLTGYVLEAPVDASGAAVNGTPENLLMGLVPATASHSVSGAVYTPLSGGAQLTGDEVLTVTIGADPDGDSGSLTTGKYVLPLNQVQLAGGETLQALKPGDHLELTVTIHHNRLIVATATIEAWHAATATGTATWTDPSKKPDTNS